MSSAAAARDGASAIAGTGARGLRTEVNLRHTFQVAPAKAGLGKEKGVRRPARPRREGTGESRRTPTLPRVPNAADPLRARRSSLCHRQLRGCGAARPLCWCRAIAAKSLGADPAEVADVEGAAEVVDVGGDSRVQLLVEVG